MIFRSGPYDGTYQARKAGDGTRADRGGDDAKWQGRLLTGDADDRCRYRPEDELAKALQ